MANEFKFSNSIDNFEDIVQNLKDYYISLGYNFANGSNFDLLVRTFAWYKMSLGQDISNLVNNLYISSANNKNSIFELAKSLGYNVRRNIPSRVKSKLSYNGTQSTDFTAKQIIINGKNNNFDFSSNNVKFSKSNITGKYEAIFDSQEKTKVSFTYYGTGEINQKITLPEINITDDNFNISSKIGNLSYIWNNTNSFETFPNSTSPIYFLTMSNGELTEITFGNGVIGRVPQSNEIFTIEYYITNSTLADNETEFSLKSIIVQSANNELNNVSNYTINSGTSFGSQGNETISEIQVNAPKYFSNLNNNIVKRDFENLLQIQSDYVAYSNIANTESSRSILSDYYFLLVPNNYVNQTTVDNSKTYTLPFEAIENLVVSTIEYDKYSKYFTDWIYIKIASPTYLYYDIIPEIKVNKYKDFNIVSDKVYSDLKTYISENLYGFNKSYYENALIRIVKNNSDVSDVTLNNNYYIVFNKANILDKNNFKIPRNFIKSDVNHFNDLINYSGYNSTFLKDEDKTILSDNLSTSDENFVRYFVSTNEKVEYSKKQLFSLFFQTTGNYELVESLSQINRLEINNSYIDVKIFKVTEGVRDYALYTTDNIIIRATSPSYTISSTTKYLVYLSYANFDYLFAEIKEIGFERIKIVEKINNMFYIDNLFDTLNIAINTASDFLTFSIAKISDENTNSYWNLTADIKVNQVISNIEQTNLMVASRKEIGNYDFSNNVLNQIDSDIICSIVDNKINLSADAEIVCTLSKNNNTISVDESSLRIYPAITKYENYKNRKFSVIKDDNIFRFYAYENIDSSIIATIDNINGNIYFNDNISYKQDELTDYYIINNLSFIIDKVVEESKIYRLKLISKNNIPTFNNIVDSFESNGNIFSMPNLGLINEIKNNNAGIVNE